MMHHKRILGIALFCFLASVATAGAKGKHKAVKHGKVPAKSSPLNHDTPAAASVPESAIAKTGSGPSEARAIANRPPLRESVKQESRIEFDERMLKGQSAAGVIYLFQRTPSDWKSIVEVPDSFRARTVNVLAPAEEKK
jgi:hypothetical protein